MKKNLSTELKAEIESIQNVIAHPKNKWNELLFGENESECNFKNLDDYTKKHKKEIDSIKKKISVSKIIKEVERRRTTSNKS